MAELQSQFLVGDDFLLELVNDFFLAEYYFVGVGN